MQRFRFLSLVLTATLVLGAFAARADSDTPAQAAARAALEQQMNQSNTGQTGASTNATPPPPAAPSMETLPPITTPTPQFSTNIPANSRMEPDMATMSHANQAAAARMKSQTNLPAITAPPPSVLNTNETEQYPVNPAMAPLPDTMSMPPTHSLPGLTTSPGAAAQQPPPATAIGSAPSLRGEPKGTNSAPNFENITAPPLPVSPEKQSELQSLLSQYMANQITPAQYQEQRQKILAEP
ncbi:MAG: hypothetical protein ACREFR_13455 [Limisphaerales bacterium]